MQNKKKQKKFIYLTSKQKWAIHKAIQFLADLDQDYASEDNNKGFNAFDTYKGHKFAKQKYLSWDDAKICFWLAHKYRKQLPIGLKKIIFSKEKEFDQN